MSTETTRPETPEEAAEREAREAAEALAARAAELAELPDADLCRDATDDELEAEDRRLATLPRPSSRAILTIPRARGHERLRNAREGLAGAATAAIVTAARGAAKPDGPSVDDLRRAHDLHLLAQAGEEFWTALGAVIDAPEPPGMSPAFSDDDPAAEIRAAHRAIEARRDAIRNELEARQVAVRAAALPGMAQRLASLLGGAKGGKS